MDDHFIIHEGYVEIIDSNYSIPDAFRLMDEAARHKKDTPAPPEGYHILEDLSKVTEVTPAAHIIVRTLLASTPIHCIALFGGTADTVTKRKLEATQIDKGSIHHFFTTREEAVEWLMKNHDFKK